MPIPVTCDVCGAEFNLRDEYAGRRMRCPKCQNALDVPQAAIPRAMPVAKRDESLDDDGFSPDVPEIFRGDKFLLRQKLWSIKEKYRVTDEDGETILYVERPLYLAAGILAALAGFAVMAIGIGLAAFLASEMGDDAGLAVGITLGVIAFVLGIFVIVALYPRRHILFYTDESKEELVLEVKQDSKLAIINFWYTLTDADGTVLARFRKNYLHGILRKRWYIHSPDGAILFEVKEDSIILSLLRRTIGTIADELPLLGLALAAALRTNFVFTQAYETKVIGEFNRRLTILDRYVLDLTDDTERVLDRRVAVAMGVLLDTGERR